MTIEFPEEFFPRLDMVLMNGLLKVKLQHDEMEKLAAKHPDEPLFTDHLAYYAKEFENTKNTINDFYALVGLPALIPDNL